MQSTHLLGAGCLIAALGWFVTVSSGDNPPGSGAPSAPPAPPTPRGHYVFVVEGDRDQLAITHANRKADPWAGTPKGFTSDWTLTIHGGDGTLLAEVPLDVRAFDVEASRKGQPLRVEGCVVLDPRIGMLVNAPCFDEAATYTMARRGEAGRVVLGTADAARIRDLAGGGR